MLRVRCRIQIAGSSEV